MSAWVTDTHSLLWFAEGRLNKLGKRARAAFGAVESGQGVVHVPAVVILETWFLAQAGRLKFEVSFTRWWKQISSRQLILEPLMPEDVFAAADLAWDHRDDYDRMIVACARRLELPLITADVAVTDSGLVEVCW